jgi:hypothetical protein
MWGERHVSPRDKVVECLALEGLRLPSYLHVRLLADREQVIAVVYEQKWEYML